MKKSIKIFCFYIFMSGIFCHLTMSAAAGENLLGFAEAWQKMTAGSDTLAAAREDLHQAKHKRDAARDLYLPEIEISASYMRLDDEVTLSPNDILSSMPAGDRLAPFLEQLGRTYGLSGAALNTALTSTIAERDNRSSSIRGSWPIYAGGRIDAAQDIAAGQEKEADKKLEMTGQEQFENLARYYFGAVLASQVYQTKGEVAAGLAKHFEHAVLLERQGQIAKVERIQAEAAYDKAKVEHRKAGHDLEITRIALTRLLKMVELVTPADTLLIPQGHNFRLSSQAAQLSFISSLPPLETFLEDTLAGAPGLHILKAKHDQAAGLAAVEEGKYYPSVAVFGSYSLYEEDDLASKMLPDWVLGIGVKIPLLERSGRSGNLQAAKSVMRRLDYLQNQARSDLAVLVEKTYRQAEQALEEYQGLNSSLKLAEETVNLRVKSFDQGLSTSLDVVDAEMFLAGIKTQRAGAVYGYVLALAKLTAISGRMETFFTYQLP